MLTTRRAVIPFLLGFLWCVSASPEMAFSLSVTIDGVTLTPPAGSNVIDLQGTFGTPQPGLIEGLRIEPTSFGVTPRAFFADSPTFKFLGITDFALVGPRASNQFFYPFNAHTISIEHQFKPFAVPVVGNTSLGMSGSYNNEGNRFVIGGELRASGFLNQNQIAGPIINSALTSPLFIPNGSALIYHPADDIRFRGNDLPNHSCDNIIGAPTRFSCGVSQFVFLPADSPLNFRADLNLTFVDSDRFLFPGSLDTSLSVVPEPNGLVLFASGLALLLLWRWRRVREHANQSCRS